MMNLMDLGVETIDIVTDAGNEYECALDTGEVRLGKGSGISAFAYDADDVRENVKVATDYNHFCEKTCALDPLSNDWLEVAVALARRGFRLLEPGTCNPALSEREYKLVRMAFDQAKKDKAPCG